MERRRITRISTVLVILVLLLTACGGRSSTQAPAAAPQQPAVESPSGQTEGGETAQTVVEAQPQEEGISEMIPIMPNGYDVTATSKGTKVDYKVDATIEDVINYYQDELEKLGWEKTRTPDTSTGNIGTMLRENAESKRITLNMQYNPNAQFTVVTVVVVDK